MFDFGIRSIEPRGVYHLDNRPAWRVMFRDGVHWFYPRDLREGEFPKYWK